MNEVKKAILQYLIDHPNETYRSVALRLNLSPSTITSIAKEGGLPSKKAIRPDLSKLTVSDEGK